MPKWSLYQVMVKLMMIVVFRDINKACTINSFPMPHLCQIIDATAGHEAQSFLDVIWLHLNKDEPEIPRKNLFVTKCGTCWYNINTFKLKNVDSMFEEQIGKTMQACSDDMLTKSLYLEDHLEHL